MQNGLASVTEVFTEIDHMMSFGAVHGVDLFSTNHIMSLYGVQHNTQGCLWR